MDVWLEWRGWGQVRWHGAYEVIHISATEFRCKMGQFRLDICGEQVEVDYLASSGFLLRANTFSRMTLEHVDGL